MPSRQQGLLRACATCWRAVVHGPPTSGFVLHGTTLATNALIERRGARTALITTEGHRDVVEMAFENRFEQYDVNIDRPRPLVPRRWRLTVPERMNAAGQVLVPLRAADVEALVPQLVADGIDSVAIGFLHGYANPAHEEAVAEVLRRALPDLAITLASAVCPEIREFERFSTACANAYVKPLMSRYLADLQDRLSVLGFDCPFLMMTSGGGLTSLDTAREFPIRLVESGPAGGRDPGRADGGGPWTRPRCIPGHGRDDGKDLPDRRRHAAILACLRGRSQLPVQEGQWAAGCAFQSSKWWRLALAGAPLPRWIVSVASPSARRAPGSEPGPACYGRGGDHATVTDADVILGRLDPARFAGGTMTLDTQAAAQALHRDVGEPWRGRDCPVGDAAGAVSEIVDENMAAAARAHAAEWGKDTANRTLIAFGGAAPIHAARIAEKLDLDAVLVPPAAGVGSAMGFLAAPVAFEVVRSRYVRLSTFDPALVDAVMADMRAEAHAVVDAIVSGQLTELRRAYMRYLGQGYEIAVDVPKEVTVEGMRVAFDRAYEQLYGRLIPGLDVEVLSWTLTLRGEEPGVASSRLDPSTAEDAMSGRILRNVLRAGDRIDGPSTIVEDQTSTVVPQGFVARVDEVGNILVRRAA